VVVLAGLLVVAAADPASDSDAELSRLAGELVRLRGEVESLNNDLNVKRGETRDQLQFLTAQKADLEAQVGREELRVRQLTQSLEKRREEIAAKEVTRDDLRPLAMAQTAKLQAYISSSLPFKKTERLAETDKLKEQIQTGALAPEKALAQLWSLMEDEFRLCRENGLYKQSIKLRGGEQLADVARIGMVLMYYRAASGEVGMAVKGDSGWEFAAISNPDDLERIAGLFDALEKRIRQGYFELPIAR
jgi:hypothetical protein